MVAGGVTVQYIFFAAEAGGGGVYVKGWTLYSYYNPCNVTCSNVSYRVYYVTVRRLKVY